MCHVPKQPPDFYSALLLEFVSVASFKGSFLSHRVGEGKVNI